MLGVKDALKLRDKKSFFEKSNFFTKNIKKQLTKENLFSIIIKLF